MTCLKTLRLFLLFAVSGSFVLPLTSALSQTNTRFSFQQIEGGIVRLDTETGQISQCMRSGSELVCRSVADDRGALDEEIARLRRENEGLKQQLATAKPGETPRLNLPSEEEIDKAMGLFERMMRRMMRTFQDEQPAPNRL